MHPAPHVIVPVRIKALNHIYGQALRAAAHTLAHAEEENDLAVFFAAADIARLVKARGDLLASLDALHQQASTLLAAHSLTHTHLYPPTPQCEDR